MILLLPLVRAHSGIWPWVPGLLLFGAGIGVMLTSSVNVVQSSFPDDDQGEISGLSRSVSNLGSSLGTALVGSILVAVKLPEGRPFAPPCIMLVVALIGLVLAVLIPRQQARSAASPSAGEVPRARAGGTCAGGGGTCARGGGAGAGNAARPGNLAGHRGRVCHAGGTQPGDRSASACLQGSLGLAARTTILRRH